MEKKIPQRMCISCREMKNKKELLRIACFEGKVSYDPTGKAPGRGAYICSSNDCISRACKYKLLEKCFDASFDADDKEKLLNDLISVV